MTAAYPLQWPTGRARTKNPVRSRFQATPAAAYRELSNEVYRLGGSNVVISSNAPLKRDGTPYADADPGDTGVAVYFTLGKQQMVFSCDQWDIWKDNVLAIAKTIEAMRGIARWGSKEAMDRAFSGFAALPPPPEAFDWRKWFAKHGFADMPANPVFIDAAYNALAKQMHPDKGGDPRLMAELNRARDEAKKALA